jgi:HK97 family phage portal protein
MGPDDPIFAEARAAREQRSSPLENPTISLSSASTEDLLSFFGISTGKATLPHVTIETALEVPAVSGAVGFLSRTMASLPLHSYRKTAEGEAVRADGDLQMLLNEAPNPEWSSFAWRQYFWQQVFTGGRGLTWIERSGVTAVGLWPMDPTRTSVRRQSGRKIYRFDNKEYPAADVVDVPFMLKANQLDAYGPIAKGKKAIALAIAMNDFAGSFFASGGVPPLALSGPLPQGIEAFKRAQADIQRAIDLAKKAGNPFFGMPPGHELKPVGTDPEKGQMTEARLFQIQEIARIYGLPPAFVQDLSTGTFSNTEQQDLQLVKHSIAHWAKALEDELNLKLFGQRRRSRYVEHNLDGLMRGDLLSRLKGLGSAIQTALLTPDEARALDNRPPKPGGDKLYIQGATVPIEMAGTAHALAAAKAAPKDNGDNADAGTKD